MKNTTRRNFIEKSTIAGLATFIAFPSIGELMAAAGNPRSVPTKKIIDTHRHIIGPKLRKLFADHGGLNESKPLPQVTDYEAFFYRETIDADYAMEFERNIGISLSLISYGGEVEMFGKYLIRANTIDTLKFMNDEAYELKDKFPGQIECMATAHALDEGSLNVIDPLISKQGACAISISTSYGSGADQVFLDSPKAEWLWEYAQDRDLLVHIHPPMGSIGDVSMKEYRLIEVLGRPFDTALTAARMIYSGVFDRYPKLKVLFVHGGGAITPILCRFDWNWELNYNGIANPPMHKVAKNKRKPSDYFKTNIYLDTMGPSAIGLKAAIETCGIDRILFGTDFGMVPINLKEHIDLVNNTVNNSADRTKIFSGNANKLFRLAK